MLDHWSSGFDTFLTKYTYNNYIYIYYIHYIYSIYTYICLKCTQFLKINPGNFVSDQSCYPILVLWPHIRHATQYYASQWYATLSIKGKLHLCTVWCYFTLNITDNMEIFTVIADMTQIIRFPRIIQQWTTPDSSSTQKNSSVLAGPSIYISGLYNTCIN